MNFWILILLNFFALFNLIEAKGTSVSDNNLYPKFCLKAAKANRLFKDFRRHPIYTSILEHLSYEQGNAYLEKIIEQSPSFVDYFEVFRKNDLYGNPITYSYGNYGVFSPTTLRYIKVASDLKCLFKDLNNMDIIEIGGGYGGLCKIIGDLYSYKSYTIVDLPEVLELIRIYLSKFRIKNVVLLTMNSLSAEKKYDLVISNYAFTELRPEIQEIYFTKVLSSSHQGYITCNNFLNTWSKESFLKRLALANIPYTELPEDPLTYDGNYLISWK